MIRKKLNLMKRMLNMSQENSNTIDKMDMSKKITRLYLYGAIISLILVVFIIVFARENYKSIVFPMAALGPYIGVIWRGIIDPESWGKTNNMIKASALVERGKISTLFRSC